MWQKYNLNSNIARRGYDADGRYNFSVSDFSSYSPAYLGSNENVDAIINYLLPRGKSALSVVGSGDMPLMLSAYGATKVDTFDISVNAYLVLQIKMYMLKNNFDMEHYNAVLQSLELNPDFHKSYGWDVVQKTLQNDASVLNYLRDMCGYKIFGPLPVNPYWTMGNFQYAAMKYSVPQSYNFIWSDLYKLPERIRDKKYDIIYLSNIVQYAPNNDWTLDILSRLRKNLKQGGTIVLDSLNPMYCEEYDFIDSDTDWARTIYDVNASAMFLKHR